MNEDNIIKLLQKQDKPYTEFSNEELIIKYYDVICVKLSDEIDFKEKEIKWYEY